MSETGFLGDSQAFQILQSENGFDVLATADRIILERYTPPVVVINEKMEILQCRGRTGDYLAPASGPAGRNLLKLARAGLAVALHTALNKARKGAHRIKKTRVRVGQNGECTYVNIEVIPLQAPPSKERHFLILFESATPPVTSPPKRKSKSMPRKTGKREAARLEKELAATKEYLHTIIGKLKDANEKLSSANQAIPSSNEDLQSANEELETAQEELQNRHALLIQATNDLTNLLHSVNINAIKHNLALKEARDCAQAIVDTVREPLLVLDANLHVLSANQSFYSTFQVSPAETEKRRLYELGNRQWDIPWLRIMLEALQTQGMPFQDLEVVREFPAIGRRTMVLHGRSIYREGKRTHLILLAIEDATERKRTEKELAKLAAIVEASNDAILTWTLEGIIASWNPGATRMYGYSAEEALGKPIHLLIPPDHSDEVPRIIETIKRGERLDNLETRRVRKDGKLIDVSLSFAPIKDAAGRVLYVSVIHRDVTERKQMEAALRLHSEIVKNMAEGVCLVRASDDVIVYANPKFEWMLGYGPDELNGKPVTLINYDDGTGSDVETARVIAAELRQKGEATYEVHNVRKDGTPFWCRAHTSTLEHPEFGTVWVAVQGDITERKQAEEALRKQEAHYRSLIENASDIITIINADATIRYESPSIEWALGYKPEEMIGQNVFDFVHPEEVPGLLDVFNSTIQSPDAMYSAEFRFRHRDGSWRVLESIGQRLLDDSGATMLVVNSRDITERKQMEEELSRSREQLRDYYTYLQSVIEMERSRIAREIHDELGQALTALNMDLDWLAKKLPEDPATLQEKINDMSKNIDVTIKSVRRIAAELRPRLLDELGLSAAIEWQAKEFCHRAGIECEVAFYPEDIVVDRERSTAIFRILQEALTNVARHAHANMVTISLVKTERKVVLKVRDNGQGITLSQIANTNSFGLLGMRERVQPWKGRVKIKGVPNKGTIVYVSLQLDT